MNGTYETRKSVGAKVAFLGLFVAAILAARLIVALRSAVVLSEPIALTHAGLSVSMPDGNGWRSAKRWEYKENSLVLGSIFAPGSGRPIGSARCRYVFAAETTTPQVRFEQERLEVGGKIVKTDLTQIGAIAVDWVHIQERSVSFNMFFGTAELPYNRQIEIEVWESTGNVDSAERVFRRITESLGLTDSPLLDAGSQVIAEMKGKGLDSFLDNQNRQTLFLIKDVREQALGFTADVLIDSGKATPLNIEAAGLYYIGGFYAREQMMSFESDNRFDRFSWKSETVAASRRGTKISLDETGTLTITKFGEQLQENRYRRSPVAIPGTLLEQLLRQMLDSDKKEIIVDLIEPGGRIIPTYISGIETEDIAPQEEVWRMVKLTPLDGRGFFQWVYLDDQKQISKILVREEEIYIYERADAEEAARLFPERAEYILQSDKLERYLRERK